MFTMHPWLWLLIIAVIIWKINLSTAETRVVCYYTNWSVYRPGTAKFNPQNINPYLCTHLIYAFGGFTKENNFKPFDKYQDIEKGGYAKFTGLKTYNKNLKTMLAVGGWNEGSSRFSPMVANAERRKEFVKNSIKFMRQNHFDGLDLDWEYPSFRDGGKPRDRDNYATLVQELREEYDRESQKTGRPRLLLTMAVPAGIEYINKGYDVPKLMKYLDWMNILSYDYHSAFEPAVNHHSPLFSMEEDSEYNYDAELNINHTINHYLDAGAVLSKLVLGIPTYGRSYTLFNPDATEIGDPADGPGEMGDATRENGYLAYYEICEKVKSEDWVVEQPDPNAMGPYAYKDNQWVGYDDENIVKKKAEFVAKRKMGGIMFWSIDNDDFRGNCHGKPYPLIEAAKEALMAASGYPSDNVIAPEKPTKTSKSRGRTRPSTKKASIDEEEESKPAQNSGGRQSADIPASRKRTRPKSNQEAQRNSKRRLRVQEKEEEEEEEEEEIVQKPRLRPQKEQTSRRKENKRRGTTTTTTRPSALTPAYHTPEPPTTPDPGSDFKCEDEGFFPHPRDCKKYFWCLSSGPSELGIVAHQFTCPSGLYFNKAADSCDYTQNVLCKKKAKEAATTTTTTTESTSTTRKPTQRTTTTTFRTTSTTSEYEEEYEYEDEDEDVEDEDALIDSEEDPRVIKELIDLIRKAGGIEELEKQLKLHEDGSVSITAPGSTTQPAISKTLYERVLSRAAARNTEKPALKPKNSRGPQYNGGDESGNKRSRPQYTAISRQRASTEKSQTEESEEQEENQEEKSTSKKIGQPQYKTIARSRGSTTTTESDIETTRLRGETTIDEDNQETTKLSPEYVTIKRTRPTTQETTPKYVELRSRTPSASNDEEAIVTETTTTTTDNKTSELSNNEYINTVEQQNITDTVEVAKTTEGTILPDEPLQNTTDNSLSQDEKRSSQQPSTTTASTKVRTPLKNFSRRPIIRSTSTRFKQLASTTPALVVSSRPTKTSRRKFHSPSPTTARTQETTIRQSSRNYLRFSSKKPFIRMTTLKSIEPVKNSDQTLESTNQQTLEKEFNDDTTKLGDLAAVLNEMQKTSVRPRTTNRSHVTQSARRLISTTVAPVFVTTQQVYPTTFIVKQQQPRPFEKVLQRIPQTHIFEPVNRNYDYYDEDDTRYVTQLPANSKVLLHGTTGIIQCLDQGNFPHPASCKKFIYCAKVDSGDIIGWEYTCPKNLSFDPVGGICNWSAGLGCNE